MQKISCSFLLAAFLTSIAFSVNADKLPEKATENAKGGWDYEHEEHEEYMNEVDPERKDRMLLCDEIKDRLNKYSYPDPTKAHVACGLLSTLAYSAFSEPPWQELDPKKHEELLWKLFKYSGQGSEGYFNRGLKHSDWMTDERYQQQAKELAIGGVLSERLEGKATPQ